MPKALEPQPDPSLSDEQRRSVECLLTLRPDLAFPSLGSMAQLRTRAERADSTAHALLHLNELHLAVLECLVAMDGHVTVDALLSALSGGAPERPYVETALQGLADRWLVSQTDQLWACSPGLQRGLTYPARLGRPFVDLANTTASHELSHACRLMGLGSPTSRVKMLETLTGLFVDAESLRSICADAPAGVNELLDEVAFEWPTVSLPWEFPGRRVDPALQWMIERCMLLPSQWGRVELPREVGVAMRGGVLLADVCFASPALAVIPRESSTGETVISSDAHLIVGCVSEVGEFLEVVRNAGVRFLKAGSIGQREIKRLAAEAQLDEVKVQRLVELTTAAGLVGPERVNTMDPSPRRRGAPQPIASHVELCVSEAIDSWSDLPLGKQWVWLLRSWLSVSRHLSMASHRDGDGKAINVLDSETADQLHACRRHALMRELAGLGAVQINEEAVVSALTEYMRWHAYQLFGSDDVWPGEVVGDLLNEAELLALWDGKGLTSTALMVLAGQFDAVADAVTATAPAPVESLTVQSDGTIIISGPPSASMLAGLRVFADVESRDAAYILRVSETSIRRALDETETAASIVAVLDRYGEKDVPKPLRYMIEDVERRHGNVTVGEATSFVQANDPAVLSDIVRARGLGKHNLRSIAPTVAVSTSKPADLLEALRGASFFPILDEGVVAVDGGVERVQAVTQPAFERNFVPHLLGDPIAELVAEMTPDVPGQSNAGSAGKELLSEKDFKEMIRLWMDGNQIPLEVLDDAFGPLSVGINHIVSAAKIANAASESLYLAVGRPFRDGGWNISVLTSPVVAGTRLIGEDLLDEHPTIIDLEENTHAMLFEPLL